MKDKKLFIMLAVMFMGAPLFASAADTVPAAGEAEQSLLRFEITRYVLEGATLLSQRDIDKIVAPYVGKNKDFSDVQRALEAIEAEYAKRGYSAVRVLLPEQELEKGTVRFHVVESHFGKVTVKDNHYFSEANVLNAVPSVRSGSMPRTKQIARELKLANENPARQMNVVMKSGETDDQVDANVVVTDSKPTAWGVSFDNTGSDETGLDRLGFSYRNANAFDKDHVVGVQYQTSPAHPDRVKVLGASYMVPLYQSGNSMEFFGGYSNVNSVVGGLSNFQGGGRLLSAKYNFFLDRMGMFDSRLSLGLDWRDFKQIEQTTPSVIPLYNEIVVLPVSLAFAAKGKFASSDLNVNASLSANLPGMDKGKKADFAAYDATSSTGPNPDASYKVFRYGVSYSHIIADDWQLHAALNGQWSHNLLVLGEQFRLGGADGVRGFSEGSEGGEKGARLNLEGYTPDFGRGDIRSRALVFYDAGQVASYVNANIVNPTSTRISSSGVGLRAFYRENVMLRLDWARIMTGGNDPEQQAGKHRFLFSVNATF